jgi:uncharacterized protein (TIGR00661 family)
MARIFYSMAGEGRGHATRVRSIVERLRGEHEFSLFAPAAAYDMLAAAYKGTDVRVSRIPGLMFHYAHGRMNYLLTLTGAAQYAWRLNRLVKRLETAIRHDEPDLVITDFDPALPRAAERCGVPYLSIDHQHFLVDCDLSQLSWRLRMQAQMMAQVVRAYYRHQIETVISSFYFPPIKPNRRNVTQTGVLLRPEIVSAPPERAGHLLVYLRRFADASTLEALRQCGCPVHIYGLGERPRDGNLRFFPVDEKSFVESLASCDALISNAGSQLVGEALYLGKPVLAIPEPKNFEQSINAHFLRAEGGGDWVMADRFDARCVRSFLDRLDFTWLAANRHRINGLPTVLSLINRHLPTTAAVEQVANASFPADSPLQKVA